MPHFCEQLTRFFTGRQPVATDPSTSVHDANQMAPSQSRTHGTTARSMRLAYPGAQLRTPLDHQRLGDHRQAESRPHRMRPNASLRNTASTQTEAAALREEFNRLSRLDMDFLPPAQMARVEDRLLTLATHLSTLEAINGADAQHANSAKPLSDLLSDIFATLNLSPKQDSEAAQALNVIQSLQARPESELSDLRDRLTHFRNTLCETPETLITPLPEKETLPEECPLTFEPITVPLRMSYAAEGHHIDTIYSLPTALISWAQTGCDPTTNCPVEVNNLSIIITSHDNTEQTTATPSAPDPIEQPVIHAS